MIESAHWPRGVDQIIEETLLPRFRASDDERLIEGSLGEMRAAILAAHEPLDEVYKFVCTNCHQTHFRTDKDTSTRRPSGGQGSRGREKLVDILEGAWPRSVSTDQLILRSGLLQPEEFRDPTKVFRARKNIASKIYHLKKDGFDVGSDGTGNYWGRRRAA
ncbi:hypothetical protein Rumeso_03669 [Rubellimicrobium mesophilum DSM 19309]|uniref:Uncharacterized protein n=1 Tax=Rubellimicrobium mesophilum DSM 19309 TaxID=442562 RepID=A0A017HK32_9RHOB|nr:hypothetical protein [Rubellimicrobium mesophilum]EYD74716.1 hypothetical protein Rumeso_03669 [Rubellimicrobium mesophilum DSM 19309]